MAVISTSKAPSPGLVRRFKSPTADSAVEVSATAPPTPEVVEPSKTSCRLRTLFAILYLYACAPFLVAWALVSWFRYKLSGRSYGSTPQKHLRVLVTGGKMSKCSAVARAVGRDGHKVFTAEILPYQFCHTRFCTYVSKHYILPRPTEQPKEWLATMQQIVSENNIDLIIPCTAPIESTCYAHLRASLPKGVRVFAFDGETSDILDNKYTFNQELVKAGLQCPETGKMECLADAVKFFEDKSEDSSSKKYIVKPAVYDPKARTEILFLPIADKQKQMDYLKSRNASKAVPYVIQEVLIEPEYGSYAVYNQGNLTAFEFFNSCASCLSYSQLQIEQYNQVLELHKGLGKSMNLTGQLTFDLMHTAAGDLIPIECNPRIHSAICTLEGHPKLGAALCDPDYAPETDAEIITSRQDTQRFWIMDQLFLMAGFWKPKNCFKLSFAEMLKGDDALLSADDPMPFLAMYLVQIPSLLALELISGQHWLKIDFCIGKIVKEGGD